MDEVGNPVGFDWFDMWKGLLVAEYREAAVALLGDLLDDLGELEGTSRAVPDGPAVAADELVALREQAMLILNDKHGSKLRNWQKMRRSSRKEFRDEAEAWFDHCRYEEDVFGLFPPDDDEDEDEQD